MDDFFIYTAIVGSLKVSYIKARAEGLGIEYNVGLLARPERVVLLASGLLSGIWILGILAVFSNVTAVERVTRETQPVHTMDTWSAYRHARA